MTREELLALPAVVPLDVANRALDIGRTKGYQMAKRDLYPCAVLRLGQRYRVVTSELLRVLKVDSTPASDAATEPDENPATALAA
jgi:hypothetical protein